MGNPNVVFIIVDALRTDRMGCYQGAKAITPNMDALARNGVLFENNFACINVTDPSLTTIFSGRYPTSHGLISHGPHVRKEDLQKLDNSGTRFLPEILKSKRYVTLAVDWLNRWHKRGYDYYSGLRSALFRILKMLLRNPNRLLTLTKLLYRYRRAIPELILSHNEGITDHAIELMRKVQNRKFFLFLHYWGTHAPYITPKAPHSPKPELEADVDLNKPLMEVLNPKREKYHLRWFDEVATIGETLARYEGAVNFVDSQIGELMEELDELDLREDTLVIFTSDHGESLIEHGIYFDHHGLYDVSLHVPLIFSGPGFPEKRRIDSMVQHLEIVPTILDSLGYDATWADLDGESTFPLVHGEGDELRSEVYAEEAEAQRKRAVRTRDYKYIFAPNEGGAKCRYCNCIHGGVEELYDLKEDPQETQNIIWDEMEKSRGLKRKFLNFSSKLKRKNAERERVKKKTEELKKLSKI